MTWLIAVALRPFGALVFFGAAAALAFLIRPLIPSAWRPVLYDRTLRKRHPWKVFWVFAFCFYGTVYAVYWLTK